MPAIGVTTGVPSAAVMSWPWWVWPGRPTPKRASGPPNVYGPWTGKSFEPVAVVTAAGAAGTGVGVGVALGVGATTLKGAR